MRKTEALRILGGETAVARILNISRQAVHKWGETIPIHRALQLEIFGVPARLEDYGKDLMPLSKSDGCHTQNRGEAKCGKKRSVKATKCT